MGKGDKRTRRGKIFAGSFGKARPKPKHDRKHKAPSGDAAEKAEAKKAAPEKPAKKKPAVKKAAPKKQEETTQEEAKAEAAQEEE